MKKEILLFVLGAIVALGAQATDPVVEDNQVRIVPGKDKVVRLLYAANADENVRVVIRNSKGHVVKQDFITKTQGFMRPYNFEKMPDGRYQLEIADGRLSETHQFDVISPRIINVHAISNGKFKVYVSQSHPDPYSLHIFDENSRLIHSEEHPQGDSFAREYDLTALSSASYQFKLSNRLGEQRVIIE